MLDLAHHAETLGDPSLYFVHDTGAGWVVVEHATGAPRWRIVGQRLESLALAPPTPAPADGAAFVAVPGRFQFAAVVN